MSVSRHGGLTRIDLELEIHSRSGEAPQGKREKEKERNTHAGGTTHDGPVICWTPHGHVVFHGHEVHSIVHFLALSRGVSYRQRSVQLYGRSRLRATRIDAKRGTGRERKKGCEEGSIVWHLSARDECDGKRIII